MVLENLENLAGIEGESIGTTLEEQKKHFEARLIARALEQENGSVTRAARELGLSHPGLLKILDGRQSKTLGAVRSPKRVRRKSGIMRRPL